MPKSLFILLLLVFAGISCEDDPFETSPSKGNLEFSKDTVYLDTVFTNISSSTRTFKVYNRSRQNIYIPSIKLQRGDGSYFRLNVDGNAGKSFENVEVLAKDSIYVFVEATVDYDAVTDPLYTDQILFEGSETDQKVELITLVQDAHFLFPAKDAQGVKQTIPIGKDQEGNEIRVEGFYLEGDHVWTNEKPYVVYGYAAVAPGHQLQIQKGARVYFHQGSGLLVEKDATLKVLGTREEKVTFEGDRLEDFFRDVPGQWGTIWLKPGSGANEIRHAVIRNNSIGLLLDSVGNQGIQAMPISDTEIYNTTSFGLFSRRSNLQGVNLVVGNNGESSLACIGAGTYSFTHSTFANFWGRGIRNLPAVLLANGDDYSPDGAVRNASGDFSAEMVNCIIEGNRSIEFLLERQEGGAFTVRFQNNLLRFNDLTGAFAGDPLYDFEDQGLYMGNIFNGEPQFKDIALNDLRIKQESSAIGLGSKEAAAKYPFDLLGTDRSTSPDSGAYQHQFFEEE